MTRMFVLGSAIALAIITISLLLVATASAAPKTVVGTVGPGFTIDLKLGGKQVTRLRAGVPYRFVISDQSSIHDFHLSGPGLNRVLTGISYTGTRTIVLTLKKGTYRFMCDPHAALMHGSFRAG
jgi:hypothetical protein